MEVETTTDHRGDNVYSIHLTEYEALDVLAVLAQTPIAFFDDEDSAEFIKDLHGILKRTLRE